MRTSTVQFCLVAIPSIPNVWNNWLQLFSDGGKCLTYAQRPILLYCPTCSMLMVWPRKRSGSEWFTPSHFLALIMIALNFLFPLLKTHTHSWPIPWWKWMGVTPCPCVAPIHSIGLVQENCPGIVINKNCCLAKSSKKCNAPSPPQKNL